MKKKMLLLLFLMLFPLIIYAEPAYIFLGKSSTESYIVKQGDVITMYLLSNYGPNDDGLLESYNVQLYYNPYVFELVKTENEYIKLPEGWQVTNYKTYSSLINLSVKNNTLENTKEKLEEDEYSGIIAKLSFRVKDNAVNQKTYIELLKDNYKNYDIHVLYLTPYGNSANISEENSAYYSEIIHDDIANFIEKFLLENKNILNTERYKNVSIAMEQIKEAEKIISETTENIKMEKEIILKELKDKISRLGFELTNCKKEYALK